MTSFTFGNFKFVVRDDCPDGKIYFIPPVTREVVIGANGEVTETLTWNPKAGGIITNVGSPDSRLGK